MVFVALSTFDSEALRVRGRRSSQQDDDKFMGCEATQDCNVGGGDDDNKSDVQAVRHL